MPENDELSSAAGTGERRSQVSTLYLVRHGQTTWNRDGNRYAGASDIPLTDIGRAQAEAAAEVFAGITVDAVYSSALMRAKHTAEAIARRHDVAVVQDPRLNEMTYGRWEGRTHADIQATERGFWETWAADPATHRAGGTGETSVEVFRRMNDFVDEVFTEGSSILVVGHHTANRVFLAGSLGMPLANYRRLSIDNLGVCVLERSDWGIIWRGINLRWVP